MMSLPNDEYFLHCEWDVVHLRNEDGSHCFVKSRSVHVHCCSHWKDESRDPWVYSILLFNAGNGNGERGEAKSKI